MRRYGLRDEQWDRIKDFLPGREGSVGATAKDNRLFVEAVLYRYRAGIPWRDLPGRFGDFRVIHSRHSRWSQTGVWEKVFKILSQECDNEYAMIDSTIVRAHQHAAGAKKKSSKTIKPLDEAVEDWAPRFTPPVTPLETLQGFTSLQVKLMTLKEPMPWLNISLKLTLFLLIKLMMQMRELEKNLKKKDVKSSFLPRKIA